MSFTFTVCEEDKMAGTSWICGLYDMFDSWNQLLENEAKALGQLKTRFGEPKQLIMIGFIAYVNKSDFADSVEVDDLKWYKLDEVEPVIARVNNCSGMHFDMCKKHLRGE